jgi:hypothetical protein
MCKSPSICAEPLQPQKFMHDKSHLNVPSDPIQISLLALKTTLWPETITVLHSPSPRHDYPPPLWCASSPKTLPIAHPQHTLLPPPPRGFTHLQRCTSAHSVMTAATRFSGAFSSLPMVWTVPVGQQAGQQASKHCALAPNIISWTPHKQAYMEWSTTLYRCPKQSG